MTHSAPNGAAKEVIDLKGRKALVVGVANADSLAWWAAKHLRGAGADLAMTYLTNNAKPRRGACPRARRRDPFAL